MIALFRRVTVGIGLVTILVLAGAMAQQDSGKDSNELAITAEQNARLKALEAESASKAARLLLTLKDATKRFNQNLLSDKPNKELDQELGQQMVDAVAETIRLREVRIRSVAGILTREQKKALLEELSKPDAPITLDELITKVLGGSKK